MVSRDSKSLSVTIRCNGADAVGVTVAAAQAFGLDRALDIDRAARLAIIVEELVFNLADHGGLDAQGEVELVLTHEGPAIAILLSDNGAAFDPRGAPSEEAIPERGGGAGLDLVRAWAEILDYRSDGGWNRLGLRMPLTA
ncbi:ATP-binding protein [Sphingomonas sp. SRS2]|uniref:ATP-binding protein n=1 Tax=Sphingomonas sp. SRS2 TaxID=133190 RepID=UPI0006183F98|nr:ATP-binding protein [Sphingomonas sp. SRS2]KKC25326.1 anti-sigma regulatory factor [Sphingomonas sp. SRS2]